MAFTHFSFDERLQCALATAGFATPTPIQAAALPVALAGRDLVGTAQTGTGKTAAFVLPILHKLLTTPLDVPKTRAVILAPTRELVEQTLAVVRELGGDTPIRAVAVYGGVPMQPQTRALRNGVEIVIACPGRLLDHMGRRNTDFRQVDCLVLDEADRMFDMGFLPTIEEIITRLPTTRQTLLFSATFPRSLNTLVEKTLRDPVRVEVDTAVAAQTVRHTLYQVKRNQKRTLLTALLHALASESDSVLIFTRTRATANEVTEHLQTAHLPAEVLHAEKSQRERQQTLDAFRAGRFPTLVATDIAARGIDVTSITHVINYDLPAKADDYLHRIGRTGRMERTGHAISLVTRGDLRTLREIEEMLESKIEVERMAGIEEDFFVTSKTSTARSKTHSPKPAPTSRGKAHAPKPPKASRAAEHPRSTHSHGEDERPRRAPRGEATPSPARRGEHPARAPRGAAPREVSPYQNPRLESMPPARPARPRVERANKKPDGPPPEHSGRGPRGVPTRAEQRRKLFGTPTSPERPSAPRPAPSPARSTGRPPAWKQPGSEAPHPRPASRPSAASASTPSSPGRPKRGKPRGR
jgi:ATP-dependent RNA helicase RhlE